MSTTRQKHGLVESDDEDSKKRKRLRCSDLLEFDSPEHANIKNYSYNSLPPERNRIRLLRLFAGVIENPQIVCGMFEAEFDDNGVLRRIGNDGPTSTRIKTILHRAKLKDTLEHLIPGMRSNSVPTASEPGINASEQSQEGEQQGHSQDHENDPRPPPTDNPPQGNGVVSPQGNPRTATNGNAGDAPLGNGEDEDEHPQDLPQGTPAVVPPETEDALRVWLEKLTSDLRNVQLIKFPVLGDILSDTLPPQSDPWSAPLDDQLDRNELENVLSHTSLLDIIDVVKLEKILRESQQTGLRDRMLQEILNVVKLEEVLKRARLGEPIEYEALSWRWGDEDASPYTIMIKRDGFLFKKRVSKTLGLALKYLRLKRDRVLWIDAICIDQKNLEERSFQVSLMALVYTGAEEICVWLGEDDDESTRAINFVKDEISQLRNFDNVCTDKQHSPKWKALLVLMQRAWFSRRWVVQEIALAARAQVYCGPDQISWVDLAIAVELFVEVETATHRLSELMKKEDVVPYVFEHVSELGASVLVSATAKVFREHRGGGYGPLTRNKDGTPKWRFYKDGLTSPKQNSRSAGPKKNVTKNNSTKKDSPRRSLLSLEYLVTSLSIFDCGRPHDSIYALIAIARDAAPHPPSSLTRRTKEALVAEVFSDALEQKPYPLDYNSPYPDVCKDFLSFCIKRAAKADKVQALDILCRPWAKDWRPREYVPAAEQTGSDTGTPVPEDKGARILKHQDPWKRRLNGQEENDERTMDQYFSEAVEKFHPEHFSGAGGGVPHVEGVPHAPASHRWFTTADPNDDEGSNSNDPEETDDFQPRHVDDLGLPSWVSTIAGAAFDIFPHPGMDMVKMGRKNADPLVGVPQDGRRNYNACQLIGVDLKEVRFRRRPRLGHYSLYVKGFCFDRVEEVSHVSQAGTIPSAWLDLAGWSEARRTDDPGDPPDAFWRTLVADRGMHNQNPPYYYMRACKETIMKGGLRSNAVDTSALIHNERNSIVAEFCRRVQAVIWNRALFRTKKGDLGLASEDVRKGDWVCLIYGCTVPVILRKHGKLKTQKECQREEYEDSIEALVRCTHRAAKGRFRRARYQQLKKEKPGWEKDVQEKLEAYEAAEQAKRTKYHIDVVKNLQEKDQHTYAELEALFRGTERPHEGVENNQIPENGQNPENDTIPENGTIPENDTIPENNTIPENDTIPENNTIPENDTIPENNTIPENGPVQAKDPHPEKDTEAEEEVSESESDQDEEGSSKRVERQEKATKMDPFRHYKFIGEAYIHGMMDGEAVRQKFYKGKPDHAFELR